MLAILDNQRMSSKRNQHRASVFIAQSAIKIIATVGVATVTVSCTPAFNWREVSMPQAGVTALLPCKPDRGVRSVQLAGQAMQMSMAGCESGGAMFTLSLVEVPAGGLPQAVAQELQALGKATHSRQMAHGRFVAQAAIYGQPAQGIDGPSALSAQAVETFLSNLKMAGVP